MLGRVFMAVLLGLDGAGCSHNNSRLLQSRNLLLLKIYQILLLGNRLGQQYQRWLAEITGQKLKRRKLPQGTSVYQATWIIEDTDDEVSYVSVEEGDDMVVDGQKDHSLPEVSDELDNEDANNMESLDEETEADTEMADDDNLTREQVEAELKKLKDASGLDEEFPDEVDTPLDIPAKKCFARYRGLKSFRTSSWDPQESLPPEYARIFNFDNFERTQKHVLAKVQGIDQELKDDSAQVGSFVRVHVKDVPVDIGSKLFHLSQRLPVVACGLLQHESKMSVLHFSYPPRVSKKKATVRYMFHHPEDARWFKPVELYTKCGRGRIKDSVGTHGAVKCVFNGAIQQHDTVCMSLYKRAYPKWPDQLFPLQ